MFINLVKRLTFRLLKDEGFCFFYRAGLGFLDEVSIELDSDMVRTGSQFPFRLFPSYFIVVKRTFKSFGNSLFTRLTVQNTAHTRS